MKSIRTSSNNTVIRKVAAGALIAASVFIPFLSFADTTAPSSNGTITGTSTGTYNIDSSCIQGGSQNCTSSFSFSLLPNPTASVTTTGSSASSTSSVGPSSSTTVGAPPMTTTVLGGADSSSSTQPEATSSSVIASSTAPNSSGSTVSSTSTASTEASSTTSSNTTASSTPGAPNTGGLGNEIVPAAQAATTNTASTSNSNESSTNSQEFAAATGGLMVDTSNPVLGFNPFNATTSAANSENVNVRIVPSINLTWQTSTPGTSVALFSPSTIPIDLTSSSTPSVVNSDLATDHTVTLTGLAPNTMYSIVLQSRDPNGNLILSNFFNLDIQTASSTQMATSTENVSAIPFNGTSGANTTNSNMVIGQSAPIQSSTNSSSSASTTSSAL